MEWWGYDASSTTTTEYLYVHIGALSAGTLFFYYRIPVLHAPYSIFLSLCLLSSYQYPTAFDSLRLPSGSDSGAHCSGVNTPSGTTLSV